MKKQNLKPGDKVKCISLAIRKKDGWSKSWTKKEGCKIGSVYTISFYKKDSGTLGWTMKLSDSPRQGYYWVPASNFKKVRTTKK